MKLNAIVAMSENRVIGYQNKLPWHLPADLQHFKSVTWGKPIVMGRKTIESIGRALPGRLNVVLTRNLDFKMPGVSVVHSIEEALILLADQPDIFMIGGAELYKALLPRVQTLYLTLIHHYFVGDAFFPELNLAEWHTVERTDYPPDEKNIYPWSFVKLERRHE